MEFPIEIQKLIHEFAKPLTNPYWKKGTYIAYLFSTDPELRLDIYVNEMIQSKNQSLVKCIQANIDSTKLRIDCPGGFFIPFSIKEMKKIVKIIIDLWEENHIYYPKKTLLIALQNSHIYTND
tara:strand:- start:203 stop:571 length:369 start_codon:yes stop_codon:yes gene_type:complete